MGAILNTRRWSSRKEATWRITERVSTTYSPPRTASSSWVLVNRARAARVPPRAREPVSPMKMRAGGAFHHRNPAVAPIMAAATMARSWGDSPAGNW